MGYPNRRSIERWRKEHGPRHCAALSPELVPGLHQSLRKPECENIPGNSLAFIGDQAPELACFPLLLDRIKCCVVNETVDVPVWMVAQRFASISSHQRERDQH